MPKKINNHMKSKMTCVQMPEFDFSTLAKNRKINSEPWFEIFNVHVFFGWPIFIEQKRLVLTSLAKSYYIPFCCFITWACGKLLVWCGTTESLSLSRGYKCTGSWTLTTCMSTHVEPIINTHTHWMKSETGLGSGWYIYILPQYNVRKQMM